MFSIWQVNNWKGEEHNLQWLPMYSLVVIKVKTSRSNIYKPFCTSLISEQVKSGEQYLASYVFPDSSGKWTSEKPSSNI